MKYLPGIYKRLGSKDHNAVIDSIDEVFSDMRENTALLKDELVITTATDQWLNLWGEWFGVKRRIGESDEAMRERIIEKLTRDRLTVPAFVELIKKALGDDTTINIYEPFRNTRRMDESTFDGTDRYQDLTYFRIGTVDITIDKEIPAELLELLQEIKAAGIKLYINQNLGFFFPWQRIENQ